jgi:hypothetical protein
VHDLEHQLGDLDVVGQVSRAVDGEGSGGDAIGPTSNLVPERAEGARPRCPDRSESHDASPVAVVIDGRPHLDHEPSGPRAEFEDGVIEVEWRPM